MPTMASDANDPARNVVHLLERLDPEDSAPPELLLPRHLGGFGRGAFAAINCVVTVAVVVVIFLLWTDETPGWWFNAIFTVMLGGIAVALWAILRGAGVEAADHEAMEAAWGRSRHRARAERGQVTARSSTLTDRGAVSSFELTVMLDGGSHFSALWRPAKSPDGYLLQPQVPGVGSDVRVWLLPEDAGNPTEGPAVIQVADATVILR